MQALGVGAVSGGGGGEFVVKVVESVFAGSGVFVQCESEQVAVFDNAGAGLVEGVAGFDAAKDIGVFFKIAGGLSDE